MAANLTLDDMEAVIKHWESLDWPMTEEIKRECLEAIESSDWTLAQWMEYLHPVPDNVGEKYRKAMKILLDHRLITQESYEQECVLSKRLSPVYLAKSGKFLMDWYREEQALGFPNTV